MYVCSLIVREWDEQLSPNFQGSYRTSQGWFQVQTGVMGKDQ